MWERLTESEASEKPYIDLGTCCGRWQTGQLCEVEDKVLLSFVMEVYETHLAQGHHLMYEHFENAPTSEIADNDRPS